MDGNASTCLTRPAEEDDQLFEIKVKMTGTDVCFVKGKIAINITLGMEFKGIYCFISMLIKFVLCFATF